MPKAAAAAKKKPTPVPAEDDWDLGDDFLLDDGDDDHIPNSLPFAFRSERTEVHEHKVAVVIVLSNHLGS